MTYSAHIVREFFEEEGPPESHDDLLRVLRDKDQSGVKEWLCHLFNVYIDYDDRVVTIEHVLPEQGGSTALSFDEAVALLEPNGTP